MSGATGRDRLLLVGVVVLAVLGAYWFLLLAPRRTEVAKLDQGIAAARQELTGSLATLQKSRSAREGYAMNYATVARLGQAVPADDGVASMVFQLDAAARSAHVEFRSVKLVAASEAPAATVAADPTQAATSTLPPGAAVGPAGFPTMPFVLTFDGSFFRMAGFLARLERFVEAGGRAIRIGGRLLAIDGMTLSPSRRGFPSVKASVAATAYLVAPGQGATNGASPAAPAAAGQPQPASSPAAPAVTPAATATPPLP